MTAWLDRASALAVLVVCGLAVFRFWPSAPPAIARTVPELGSHVASIEGIDFRSADATVLLVMHSKCQYCTKSMPFYRTLAENLRHGGIRLYAVSPEPQQIVKQYLDANGLLGVPLGSAPHTMFEVPGTPAILIVKPDSALAGVWSGWLAPEREKQVLDVIGTFRPS